MNASGRDGRFGLVREIQVDMDNATEAAKP
jgi:hypothetical protein